MSGPRGVTRIVDACFGAFLLALAPAVVVFADAPIGAGPLLLAAVLAFAGGEALLAARANRPSLLSRIGPLP